MSVRENIPWMGDLPEGWKTRRAKYLFRQMRRPIRPEDGVVTAFRDGQVTLRTNRRTEGFTFADKEIGYQGVRPGDLVIHAMDAFAGAIGVSDSEGKMSPVCSICHPHPGMDSRYYAALLRHMSNAGFIQSLSRGIRERSTDFRFAQFADLPLLVPPISAQRAIADFLDRKTASIDALIQKKEKLIELLEEKRAGLINQAVTKGLDPNVPMKDSGIPWIGEIPAHWDVVRMKYIVASIQMGPFGSMLKDTESTPTDFKLVGQENTISGDFTKGSRWLTKERYEDLRKYHLRWGDLVLTRKGSLGHCQEFNAEVGCVFDSDTIRLRVDSKRAISSFVLLTLRESSYVQTQILQDRRGAIIPGLNTTNIADLCIICPPLEEQSDLVDAALETLGELSGVIAKINTQVSCLREFRQSVITAAVSGQTKIESTGR